ncbi:MAG: efflux RND transporter permease subunit [Spirochaetales bacterium]|nr:efflux RND transporter permease subunit [Spirochaetales bacterium]
MSLTDISVNRPVTIVVIAALLLAISLFLVPGLAVDLYPSVDPPFMMVYTLCSGAAPEEVEESVTRIIEKQLSNLEGLNSIRSTSAEGYSRINLEFGYDVDLDDATNNVRDALERVTDNLPEYASSPQVMKFDINSRPIMRLVIQGDASEEKLKQLAEDVAQPRLERIAGVASAETRGGTSLIFNVSVSQSRLQAYNLNISQVSSALAGRNYSLGTGSVEREGIKYNLRVDEKFGSIEDIKRTVIASLSSGSLSDPVNRSTVVRLEDIAEVELRSKDTSSIVQINGKPSISIRIQNESDTNSVQVVQGVKAELPSINKELPDGISVRVLYDDTKMVESTLNQVYKAAWQGGLLAMLILFIFLRNIKSTLIIGLSLPLSILVTLTGMYFFNLTLNLITLTGLILGLGMIVDNSIVILENIYRYREKGAKLRTSAILGSREMMTAIIASTLTTLCVFVPMIIWRNDLGMMGQIFTDLIFTIVLSLVISLITAITVVPALSSRFLKLNTRKQKPLKNRVLLFLDNQVEGFFKGLEKGYRKSLGFALSNRSLIIGLTVVLLFFSIAKFSTFGMNMQPQTSTDDSVTIRLTMPIGTTLERTQSVLFDMQRIIEEEVDGIENLVLQAGSNWNSTSYSGSIEMLLPQPAKQIDNPAAIKNKLKPYLNQFPDAVFAFSAGRRMGSSSPVDILIYSDDLDLASETALKVRDLLLEQFPKVEDPVSSMENGAPQYRVVIDHERAAALGLSVSDIAGTIYTMLKGRTATTYFYRGEELDVHVELSESDSKSLPDLESLGFTTPSGKSIILSNLAHFEITSGPKDIARDNETRIVHVTAGLADGAAVSKIQPLIEEAVNRIGLPEGVTIGFGGESEELKESNSTFIIIIIAAIIMVFAVMASQFESLIDPFIIFFSIPLLVIGVVLVYIITGEAFSVYSAVGIVVLAGVVVNNGIVLVDYTNLLRERGEGLIEACINSGVSRFRPIMMTSLTTILGMIPMGFFPGEGTEMIRPIGQTIVGGLAVSTLMTLFITPVMYSILNAGSERRKTRRLEQKLNLIREREAAV